MSRQPAYHFPTITATPDEFFKHAANPSLCAAMIKWINDHGELAHPKKSINDFISPYCQQDAVRLNHKTLMTVIYLSTDKLELTTWDSLITKPSDPSDLIEILRTCKSVMLKQGALSLEDWINEDTSTNAHLEFKTRFISLLFKNRLLTAFEVMTILNHAISTTISDVSEYVDELQDSLIRTLIEAQVPTAPQDMLFPSAPPPDEDGLDDFDFCVDVSEIAFEIEAENIARETAEKVARTTETLVNYLFLNSTIIDRRVILQLFKLPATKHTEAVVKEWLVHGRGGYGVDPNDYVAYRQEFPEAKLIRNPFPLTLPLPSIESRIAAILPPKAESTPLVNSSLPEPGEDKSAIEYAKQCAAYWINISKSSVPLFQNKRHPLLESLIVCIENQNEDALRRFVYANRERHLILRRLDSCLSYSIPNPAVQQYAITNRR